MNATNGDPIKSTDLFVYLGNNISGTAKDVDTIITIAWDALDSSQ